MFELVRDESGNMLAIGALGLIVTAALVGGGVDMSRAYKVQSRLQAACDAGVLAGRKAVSTNGFDEYADAEADAFFDNNFDSAEQGASGTVFTPTSEDGGNTVAGTATTSVNSTVMSIFGFDTIDVAVECSASMGVGNSDVTMVLDSTGSMVCKSSMSTSECGTYIGWYGYDETAHGGTSRMQELRDAMKNFYDTVATATGGGNARIRYAFVPYSSSINVGHLIYDLDPDYLVDEWTIQSREAVFETTTVNELTGWEDPVTTTSTGESREWVESEGDLNSNEYGSRSDCIDSLPSDTSWSNDGDSSTSSDTQINRDGDRVTTTTITQAQTRTAYTCISERRNGGGRGRGRGRGGSSTTVYVPYYTTYGRDSFAYTYETEEPIYSSVASDVFDHYVYKPVLYDVSDYKAFSSVTTRTGDDGAEVSSLWEGCIEERATTPAASFGYNSITGITPSSALDLDIDTAPDTSDNDTRWRPMWPEVAYYRTSYVDSGRGRGRYDLSNNGESLTGDQANSYCPYQSQLLQQMSELAFDGYADSLVAEGSTYHDLGMLWGARISSPEGIFQANVNESPSNGGNVSRHLIFMTDGALAPNNDIQSAYGIEFHDRRVTANGVNLQSRRHGSRFLAICEAVKAKGIRLWVIAFSTGLTDDLEACASDNSAFTATNADQLDERFQEIANQVGELRIIQ